jgi:hypothetical protein
MALAIAAGPTNSVIVDKQGMYWMAGKWKNSGEGTFSFYLPIAESRLMQGQVHPGHRTPLSDSFRISCISSPFGVVFYCSFPNPRADDGSHEHLRDAKSSLCSGGATHWLLTPDDDGSVMAVCWGQNASNGSSEGPAMRNRTRSSLLSAMCTHSFPPLYAVRLRVCPHSFAYVYRGFLIVREQQRLLCKSSCQF